LALFDDEEEDPDADDDPVDDVTFDEEFELADEIDESDSLIQAGSPLLEKSFSRRNDIVNLMMDALSSWEVMAGGRGNILASS
jgi:hypothetical protein